MTTTTFKSKFETDTEKSWITITQLCHFITVWQYLLINNELRLSGKCKIEPEWRKYPKQFEWTFSFKSVLMRSVQTWKQVHGWPKLSCNQFLQCPCLPVHYTPLATVSAPIYLSLPTRASEKSLSESAWDASSTYSTGPKVKQSETCAVHKYLSW